MELVILVPVLRRPHRVEPLLASIEESTPEPYRVLFITSPGDECEQSAISAAGADYLVMDRVYPQGDYARKINYGYQQTTEPLIFVGADDLKFHKNWFGEAEKFLEPHIGVIGTNDLGNKRVMAGHHATHFLVTRKYADEQGTIDERGKILHEGYPHEYVDDEFVQTAKKRDAWAFSKHSIVEHLHPNWGKAEMDPLYAAQRQRMYAGRNVFLRRRRLWMSL